MQNLLYQKQLFLRRQAFNSHGLSIPYSCFTILLSLCFFCMPSTNATAKSSLQKNAEQIRINIQRLESSIDDHQKAIKSEEDDEILLLEELETIDEKIWATQDKLNDLLKQVADQEKLIQLKKIDLKNVNLAKEKAKEHLKNRMNAYYTTGHVGFLNVAFSTRTLPELLSFKENFDSLIAYDKKQIQLYRTKIQELESAKQALSLEKDVLNDFVDEVNAEKTILNEIKNEKQLLINRIRTQRTLHNQAIKEMQIAARQLTKKLVQIKKKQEIYDNTFLRNKGKLEPPVPGVLITRFLDEKENALGVVRKSMGIALDAPVGTPVVAVEKGEVTFAGYMTGYGNTVIIHHGHQYFTVTSRIEKITIEEGRKVRAGSKIGITGDTATLLEDGLYFEVRKGKTSQDPLLWLDPTRIKPGSI